MFRLSTIVKIAAEQAQAQPGSLRQALLTPELQGVRIQQGGPVLGGFHPDTDTITLGSPSAAVMAHELGHAENLRKSTMYRNLLFLTDRLAKLNKHYAVPLTLAIEGLIQNQREKRDILNTLSGVSAMLAAPRLVEELNASSRGMRMLGDDPEAAQEMQSALKAYTRSALEPIAVYQLGRE